LENAAFNMRLVVWMEAFSAVYTARRTHSSILDPTTVKPWPRIRTALWLVSSAAFRFESEKHEAKAAPRRVLRTSKSRMSASA
jgi:hypothetical protein